MFTTGTHLICNNKFHNQYHFVQSRGNAFNSSTGYDGLFFIEALSLGSCLQIFSILKMHEKPSRFWKRVKECSTADIITYRLSSSQHDTTCCSWVTGYHGICQNQIGSATTTFGPISLQTYSKKRIDLLRRIDGIKANTKASSMITWKDKIICWSPVLPERSLQVLDWCHVRKQASYRLICLAGFVEFVSSRGPNNCSITRIQCLSFRSALVCGEKCIYP
jgi:hypothetical protein